MSAGWQQCPIAAHGAGIEYVGPADTYWVNQFALETVLGWLSSDPDIAGFTYEYADGLYTALDAYSELGIELDNLVMGDHPGVTFGIHLCRGNQASRWLVSGGYDWLAERLFPKVRAERLLLEYDDERSGDFEPLRAVPDDKTVVLGLVTTKTPRRETVDELAVRIREAARYVALDRLALSPQCGFATSVLGNALGVEDERAKLRTIVETAEEVWSS